MTKISILGCGWLGLPLAKALIGNGFSVKGFTTSVDKITLLENAGITTFLIDIGENEIKGNFQSNKNQKTSSEQLISFHTFL